MRRSAKLEAIAATVAALPRVWLAVSDQGIFWPDETFQSIEQSHRLAFGYGIVPWEFQSGVRSWIFPGALGVLWKIEGWLGVKSAVTLIVSAKLVMVALSVVTLVAAMRVARRLMPESASDEARDRAALFAALFNAMFPPFVLFASKCMSETASAPFAMLAVLLALDSGRARQMAAGACAAIAPFMRNQLGVVAVGLLLLLLARRRWKDALHFGAAGCVVGIAGGLVDAATWGKPFHSLLEYARFLGAGGPAGWGVSPFAYYAEVTWSAAGPALVVAIVGFVLALPRAWPHAAIVAAYFALHSFLPHKEYRYVVPILPLAFAIAATGLEPLFTRVPRPDLVAGAAATALALALAGRTRQLTFAQMGHGDGIGPGLVAGNARVWHAAEGINRLLWNAGARHDLCGIVLAEINWTSTGGFAYLHRDVPMIFVGVDDGIRAASNYLLSTSRYVRPWEYEEVAEYGGFKLYRRPGPCAPPPRWYTRRPAP